MEVITINVSGKKYTVAKHAVQRFPNTRIGQLTEQSQEFNQQEKQFYFDRNPKLMTYILDLYRTGELHLPENICSFSAKRELDFWGIDQDLIAECCWRRFAHSIRQKAVVDLIERSLDECPEVTSEHLSLRQRVWLSMEFPQYSLWSKAWFMIYMMFVITVVIIACLYTVPSLRVPLSPDNSHLNSSSVLEMLLKSEMKGVIYELDIACLVFFTLEHVIKFLLCPDKLVFLTSPLNVLDLCLSFVMWVAVILDHVDAVEHMLIAHMVLRALFCLNVLRILHLSKASTIMKLLSFTIKASLRAFGLLLVTLTMAVVIFATTAYFAEVILGQSTFQNIPQAIWWTVVTMTTVGYGDFVPRTWFGYIVGCVCSLSGILLIALPIAIIASNFDTFYSNMAAAEQRRRSKQRKMALTSGLTETGNHSDDATE